MNALALALLLPAASPVSAPPDVRSLVRGSPAIAVDPAAAAAADGFELHYRQRFLRGQDDLGNIGAYALVPVAGVALYGGWEWLTAGADSGRGSLGAALPLDESVALGAAWRHLRGPNGAVDNVWDVGLFAEPAAWLSLSLGVDDLGAGRRSGERLHPTWAAGLALRPILGAPWLTLAAEATAGRDGSDDWESRLARSALELAPLEGVRLIAAFENRAGEDAYFLGVALALSGLEAGGGVAGADGAASDGLALLTVRAEPAEQLTVARTRTVEMTLAGDLVVAGGLFESPPTIPTAVLELHAIAEDPEIGTLRLNVGALDVGLGQVDELRAAIGRVRAAGKKVIANISTADDKSYLVAAACDTIRMDPAATLSVDGFSLTALYFADGLGKLGVRFDSVEIGAYKSGPDPLTRNRPRREDELVRGELLDGAYATLLAALVDDRHLSREQAEAVIDRGMLSASEALEARLVDELTSPTDPKEVPVLPPRGERYRGLERPMRRWGAPPIVAVVPVVGTIAMRDSDNPLPGDTAAADEIVPRLEAAREDGDVIGVVLRIDSPGGELLASDVIWRAVRRVAEVKPLVVSMGDVAASGGYYVAAPAHLVIAEPNTITGSIGIFFLKADLSGLYQLAGIHAQVYNRGDLADWNGSTHPLSDEARATMSASLKEHYETFLHKVAAGRGLELEAVRGLAEGRVYTGRRALELGLVDRVGSLADAVLEVKRRAGFAPTDEVAIELPRQSVTLLDLAASSTGLGAPAVGDAVLEALRRLQAWDERVLALMPIRYDVGR